MGVFVGRIEYAPTAGETSKRDPFPDSPPMGVFVGRIQYAPTAGATSKRDPFWDSSR